jgi:hypothetical protein
MVNIYLLGNSGLPKSLINQLNQKFGGLAYPYKNIISSIRFIYDVAPKRNQVVQHEYLVIKIKFNGDYDLETYDKVHDECVKRFFKLRGWSMDKFGWYYIFNDPLDQLVFYYGEKTVGESNIQIRASNIGKRSIQICFTKNYEFNKLRRLFN